MPVMEKPIFPEMHLFPRLEKVAGFLRFLVHEPHVHIPNTGAAEMIDSQLYDMTVFSSDMGDTVLANYGEIADQLRFEGIA